MRVVVQRVAAASVTVGDRTVGTVGRGLLVLAGFEAGDTGADLDWMTGKVLQARIFPDEAGVMNRAVAEAGGGLLLVSQFTLLASTRKGNRPSWSRAAPPDIARRLFDQFHRQVEAAWGSPVPTGEFGADMQVTLVNDGPVTLIIDSRLRE